MFTETDKKFLSELVIAQARMAYVADRLKDIDADKTSHEALQALTENYTQEFECLIGENERLELTGGID